MTAAAPHVRLVGLHKRFGDKVVLDGFELEVARGEILALLGRSGTGKSVLLRLLLGLLRPDAGEVWIGDVEVSRLDERRLRELRRRMGMVFQGGALFDSSTVFDNVAYALVEQRWPRERVAARVAECLELVELAGTEALLPGQLSGGMRKRVAIARAIAPGPELLLHDEPTTGLDPATSRRVLALVRQLRDRLGVTQIVVTHDLGAVLAVADRVALLAEGRVAWLGDPQAANASPRAVPPPLLRYLGEEDAWTRPDGSR